MALDDVRLKRDVDTFFAAAEGDAAATKQITGAGPVAWDWRRPISADELLSYKNPSINLLLGRERSNMVEEDFLDFSDAVAHDPRIEKYVPEFAVRALTGDPEYPLFSKTHDVSKKSLKKLTSDHNVDAMTQKAAQYVVDNFDRYRKFDLRDGPLQFPIYAGPGNASDITSKDLNRVRPQIGSLDYNAWLKHECQVVLDSFTEIDQNGTGKITFKEVENWQKASHKLRDFQVIDQVLGQNKNGTWIEPSSDDLSNKISSLESDTQKIRKKLGIG